jgi:hypothetical protein
MAKAKKPKKEKFIEPYFKELVEVWFNYCREKFDESPTFSGSAPRDLKSIAASLRERAATSNIEWTSEMAQTRLQNFLNYAWQDNWLSKNWMLSNINRQKDKIFFNIRATTKRQEADNPFN